MNGTTKRLFSVLLTIAMLFSLGMPAMATDGGQPDNTEVICAGDSNVENCGAATHVEGCVLYVAPKITCSGDASVADCGAEDHMKGCQKYVPVCAEMEGCDKENNVHNAACELYVAPTCTKVGECGETHIEGCALYVKPVCTKTEGCTVEPHDVQCPEYVVPCTKDANCAAENHESDCVKYKAPCKEGCVLEGEHDVCMTADEKAAADKAAEEAKAAAEKEAAEAALIETINTRIAALPTLEAVQAMDMAALTALNSEVTAISLEIDKLTDKSVIDTTSIAAVANELNTRVMTLESLADGIDNFDELKAALADSTTSEITLNTGITVTEKLTITKKVTLNLNGNNLTGGSGVGNPMIQIGVNGALIVNGNGTISATGDVIYVGVKNQTSEDAALTLNSGVTVSSSTDCAVVVYDGTTTIAGATLTTQSDGYAALCGSGNDFGNVTMTSGSISNPNDVAIYWPQKGTLNISGGTVSGETGIYAKQGTVNISGSAQITASGAKKEATANNNGCTSTGDALVLDNCNYAGGTLNAAVSGGSLSSANASAVSSISTVSSVEPLTGVVSGGTLTGAEKVGESVLKNGYEVAEDGTIVVSTQANVATAEELKAALNNTTITDIQLTGDITVSETIVINRAITLDGNDKKLTSTVKRAINVDCADEVTIKNLTINCSGERGINVIQKPVTLNVENVTVTAANYAINVAKSAGAATVNVTDSNLTGLNVVNIAGAGAVITITNTKVTCDDKNENEGYGALTLNKDAVGASIVFESGSSGSIEVRDDDSFKAKNGAQNGTITIDGSSADVKLDIAIIDYGDNYYGFDTLEEAVAYAKDGEIIQLIRNATVTSGTISINSLDFNGYTVTVKNGAALYCGVTDGTVILEAGGKWAQDKLDDSQYTGPMTITTENEPKWIRTCVSEGGKETVSNGDGSGYTREGYYTYVQNDYHTYTVPAGKTYTITEWNADEDVIYTKTVTGAYTEYSNGEDNITTETLEAGGEIVEQWKDETITIIGPYKVEKTETVTNLTVEGSYVREDLTTGWKATYVGTFVNDEPADDTSYVIREVEVPANKTLEADGAAYTGPMTHKEIWKGSEMTITDEIGEGGAVMENSGNLYYGPMTVETVSGDENWKQTITSTGGKAVSYSYLEDGTKMGTNVASGYFTSVEGENSELTVPAGKTYTEKYTGKDPEGNPQTYKGVITGPFTRKADTITVGSGGSVVMENTGVDPEGNETTNKTTINGPVQEGMNADGNRQITVGEGGSYVEESDWGKTSYTGTVIWGENYVELTTGATQIDEAADGSKVTYTGPLMMDNDGVITIRKGGSCASDEFTVNGTATIGENIVLDDGGSIVVKQSKVTAITGANVRCDFNETTGALISFVINPVTDANNQDKATVAGIGTVYLPPMGTITMKADGTVVIDPAQIPVDTNGDGTIDVNIDSNNDGKYDLNVDTDGDCKADLFIDIDGDGDADHNIDRDGNNKPDLNIDKDGDGIADDNIDTDGDGKPNYKVIKGTDQAWYYGNTWGLTITVNGLFEDAKYGFQYVEVDDVKLATKHYTAKSGSTIVTLDYDYLQTLSAGTHKLTVVYPEGEASTNFYIREAAIVPDTGDNSNVGMWAAVFGGSVVALGVAAALMLKRRKNEEA